MAQQNQQNRRRRNRALQAVCAKTRICKYIRLGVRCPDERRCNFAHAEHELCDLPDLAFTRLCRDYEAGHCPAGDRCKFAHQEDALRHVPTVRSAAAASSPKSDSPSVVTSRETATTLKAVEMPSIQYRRCKADDPNMYFVQSFLECDVREGEVQHASGYRVRLQNTFLTVSFGTNVLQRSRSLPPPRKPSTKSR
eukprot:TRINITY_DN2622_c0_g1_i2.p1 TRINITY_DN2622_c0_g1~~TRINITY_DN2622_c0_g1_i2.p1  ORF type:complete len:224 (+),score=24.13 TRINITY_DN2622_c0_g1_i2:89-673(+)